ncbi:MAG: Rieske 2Fe-2S domain-containing protein [Chloroflexi bacterium]|nr:Rieske 2Fe-2S domain-containing protein [Chloroflexota bacterium]
MTTARLAELEDSPLSPFPEGWYFIETRQAIEKAKLVSRTWMGEEIIAWIDGEGTICVAEAHCPHLGANLAPEVGGRVVDGQLVCPFHGFAYDATGQCISTPYTNPPPTARLRMFHIEERVGLIFGWWGIDRRPPQWPMPDEQEDTQGWSSLERKSVRFAGHPQETTENSVDYSHLNYVHGFGDVSRTAPLVIEGHRLESRFDFQSRKPITRFAHVTFDISASTFVYGLGVSYVEVREHSIGMDLRLWVLATPIDGTNVEVTLFSQVKEITHPRRFLVGLGFLPKKFRAPLMNKFIAAYQIQDVKKDVIIWNRKKYRSRPRLFRLDGDIMPFRRYCEQFYPSTKTAATTPPNTASEATQ